MTHVPVKSSHIATVAYDAPTKVMEIKFTNGDLHRFENVPPEVHQRLISAESVGTFFHKYVRPNFTSNKVG